MDMTFEEWKEKYKPILHGGQVVFFETYGADRDIIALIPSENIWTLVEDWSDEKEDVIQFIISGFSLVNRIYYVVTKEKYTGEDYITVSTPEE